MPTIYRLLCYPAKMISLTESNFEYIENNNLSCVILAMEFMNNVLDGKIKKEDLDDDSIQNINELLENVLKLLV
jgi:hypothetical protein